MTTAIMTRPRPGVTALGETAAEHVRPNADRQLGELLTRVAREADTRIAVGRRARRTVQEMMPGYERQPVLTLYRPVMADDACPLCGRWSCNGSDCPPSSAAPTSAPPATSSGMQCDVCGGTFGAAPPSPAGMQLAVPAPTAWTCSACQNNGY